MGNFIIVKNPLFIAKKTASGLFIPEEARKDKNQEEIRADYEKLTHLEIVNAGEECKKVKVGDIVLINMNQILSMNKMTIEFEDKGYFIFRETDVILKY
jgi:co-chaperonin GroES (HSP10)